MSNSRLYGLLIAVDDYPDPVPPLGGCVNDIRKVKAYLEKEQADLKPKLVVLENEAATKDAIVSGFRDHLGQAGPDDIALVYFSGHGTQEDADPDIWPFEADGKLECIVNYDGIMKKNGDLQYNLIADKELRLLIHDLAETKAHVVTIFDCCHSGGNTREGKIYEEGERPQSRRYATARLTKACPVRPWDKFLFSEKIDPAVLQKKPLSEVIPSGQHVQLGACRSDQLAYEINGGGIFTSSLLDLLQQTKGALSYFDLRSRIRYQVKNEYQQTPQVYVQGLDQQMLFSGFLGKAVSRQSNEGNVVYNKDEGWMVDLGAMHGVAPDLDNIEIMDTAGKKIGDAGISAVKMSYTRLDIGQNILDKLDQKLTYRAAVPGALAQPIQVAIEAEKDNKEAAQILRETLEGVTDKLMLAEDADKADLSVLVKDDKYAIVHPADPERPLVKPVEGWTKKTAQIISNHLRHIAKWTFVRELHNPNVRIFKEIPIDIELMLVRKDQSLQTIEPKGGELTLPYRKMPDGSWGNAIRVKITNTHSERIYCSLVYLSEAYQVYSSLLGEPIVFLDPGESAWAFDGGDVEFDLAPHITILNHPNSYVWLKFIVSTQEFDPAVFDQEPLPMVTDRQTRGIKLATPAKFNANDWTTELITIRMPNPEYQEPG